MSAKEARTAAVVRFEFAVADLFDSQPEFTAEELYLGPSLWNELQSITDADDPRFTTAVVLREVIDATARAWVKGGRDGTPRRIRQLLSKRQDADTVNRRAEVIEGWCDSIRGLVGLETTGPQMIPDGPLLDPHLRPDRHPCNGTTPLFDEYLRLLRIRKVTELMMRSVTLGQLDRRAGGRRAVRLIQVDTSACPLDISAERRAALAEFRERDRQRFAVPPPDLAGRGRREPVEKSDDNADCRRGVA